MFPDLRSQLEVKTKLSERYKVQIEDKNKHLENKEITISEFKLNLQKVKSSHNAELKVSAWFFFFSVLLFV